MSADTEGDTLTALYVNEHS